MRSIHVLALDEAGDVLHWPRPVERVHRDEVTEAIGLQFAQPLLHARALELECPVGLRTLVERVGLGVIERDVVYVDLDPVVLVDQSQRDDR